MRSIFLCLCLVFFSLAASGLCNFGDKPPKSTQTVDSVENSRKIEGNAGGIPREPEEDYRFIVTTTLVKVHGVRTARQTLPLSEGTNNVREYLDTLAKDRPDCQVVVLGIFDLTVK